MTLTAGQIHSAVKAITSIGENSRVIPQIAKFKLAKMHAALEPAFAAIEVKRMALVQQFGKEQFMNGDPTKPMGWGLTVQDEQYPTFLEAWKAVCDGPATDVRITPITMTMLGDDPKGLEVDEFVWLGPLVVDTTEELTHEEI